MNLHKGDLVMHWTCGVGQIVNLEKRTLSGSKPSDDLPEPDSTVASRLQISLRTFDS